MISRSYKQVSSPSMFTCIIVCVTDWEGSSGGGPQHFVTAHLTKQRQLTFLVLCHIVYARKSRGSGCKGPITPLLHLPPECLGEGGGVGRVALCSRHTKPFECKASAATNPRVFLPHPPSPPPLSSILLDFAAIFQ